jgi:hypothetical protein
MLAWPALAGGSPPLPVDEYWERVEETLALVDELGDLPAETAHSRLDAAAGEWERVTHVTLSDGTAIPVDHAFLLSHLRADPPDLDRLAGLLEALLGARDGWSLQAPDQAALDRLADILARPEFRWQPEQPSAIHELWQRLLERIQEFLGWLLPDSAGSAPPIPLLRYALAIVCAGILGAVLAYTVRNLLAGTVAEATIDPLGDANEERMTVSTALQRAQALSAGGNYRTAVRYLYLSTLLLLEERDVLRYDRSMTNREVLQTVAHLPHLAATLHAIVDVFDRVWYGYQALDEAAYARYAALVTDLRRQQ